MENKRVNLQHKIINLLYEYIDECLAEDGSLTLEDIQHRVTTLGKIATHNYNKSITMWYNQEPYPVYIYKIKN